MESSGPIGIIHIIERDYKWVKREKWHWKCSDISPCPRSYCMTPCLIHSMMPLGYHDITSDLSFHSLPWKRSLYHVLPSPTIVWHLTSKTAYAKQLVASRHASSLHNDGKRMNISIQQIPYTYIYNWDMYICPLRMKKNVKKIRGCKIFVTLNKKQNSYCFSAKDAILFWVSGKAQCTHWWSPFTWQGAEIEPISLVVLAMAKPTVMYSIISIEYIGTEVCL